MKSTRLLRTLAFLARCDLLMRTWNLFKCHDFTVRVPIPQLLLTFASTVILLQHRLVNIFIIHRPVPTHL
jgi:hypothetical protein